MSARRYLPQIPSQSAAMSTNDQSQLSSHSAIEDLFQIFENNTEFITRGKRLLNKKRKLEQLRAQLNLPEDLTNEDTIKLLQLRERLKAKRRLPNVFLEPEKPPSVNKELTTINRKSSVSMPDLTPTALADTTNQSSLFDLNASLNSSVYRKRRRKLLFRKQVGPEFVIQSDSKAEKIIVPSRNPFECICQVVVLLPNNNRVQVCCKSDATVRIIYETIVTYVDLIEHDLFGLIILIDGEYFFPAMDLKISKLINDSKWKTGQTTFVMQLKIKYFVNDIALLRHFLTQHFFYLQFRQMILADTFQTTNEQKLSFATLAYQAEYGDSNDNNKLSTDFIVEHYASNDLINQYGIPNLRQEIIKRQHFYAELNDVQAEQSFVENVMKLDNYGYHMYKLYKDLKRDDIYLVGLSLSGGVAESRPVEIIDIYPNQPAALSGQLNIGDIVLSINDVSMHNRNVRDVPSIIAESSANVKLVVCRPDRREYQAYLDRQMNSLSQSGRSTMPGFMYNDQTRSPKDPLRDLPPKSPGSRRVMPKVPTKVKRGEVFAVIMNKEKDSGFGFTLSAGSTSIGYPHIRSVLREPALSAGLKHWDRILAINDADCQTIPHRDLVARLRYAPTGPVHFIIYRPRIDEIVHAKERSRQLQNTSYASISVGDQSATSISAPPSPVMPIKSSKSELFNKPVQYEKIEISLPKASQGTYGIGLSQIDPQQTLGGIFICALQPNGIAEKDGRLKIDDRLLYINDQNTDQMTYREVVEALKETTKKGVNLIIARPITDASTSNKPNIISDIEISTTQDEIAMPVETSPAIASSVIEKLIPREKPKLLPLINTEKTQTVAAATTLTPDSIDISTSSSSSTGAVVTSTAALSSLPPGSALQALIGKKIKSVPSANFDTITDKNQSTNEEKKDSPVSNTDIDEDTSDIKTPLMSPQSPIAPLPTILELKVPPTHSKSLSTSQSNEIAKRKQYYEQAASNETLILNAGVTEKIENLTTQLIDKISTPAINMDTTTLMDECREIDIKIDSDEYLEEFRALKTINEHEPIELTSIAMQPENKALNRFQNIVPYDFNRIILSTKPDYINASHIAIPIGDKSMKYIICPPPVPESINDFWQMIVEHRVQSMIGIFNEQDLKKMKCPIYWPTTIKATMTLSPFLSLTLIKHRQFDGGIDIKEFRIRISEQSHHKHEHSVIFLAYTIWPMDDNMPHDTQSFLSLIHLAHSYQTSDTPLLIHCNTGVGRTGCALLISLLLIKTIRGRTLDIYSMAKECRRQRCGIIQTEQQYRFIYDCARDALNMAIEHSIMQNAQ
ncbi:unnamed protein product [Rotaria sp. Silwood1]|nr:unnamed protein product [Rotaria sp. Silwood1]